MSKYNMASRNGKLRADSDGVMVSLGLYDGGVRVASICADVDDLRQVLGHIFDTADEQVSQRDLDRIADAVVARLGVVFSGSNRSE